MVDHLEKFTVLAQKAKALRFFEKSVPFAKALDM